MTLQITGRGLAVFGERKPESDPRGGAYQMHATAFTGPRAPMIQRTRRVWDPNRNEVRWQGGEVRDDE